MVGLLHCGFVPISVTIKDTSGTGRAVATITLDGIDDRITLRDLVRTRVRDEVARYNAAQGEYFAGLVMPDGAKATPEGFRMPAPRPVDWAQQAKRALDAFSRNGFFVLVDDRQVTDLDEELRLTVDSDIRFIRLVQLAGG
jgi:hypothetical protein